MSFGRRTIFAQVHGLLLFCALSVLASEALADEPKRYSFRTGARGIDVVALATEEVVATLPLEGVVEDILQVGSVLYVARGAKGGVTLVDVSQPLQPRVIGVRAGREDVISVTKVGDQLWLHRRDGSLLVVKDEREFIPMPSSTMPRSDREYFRTAYARGSSVVTLYPAIFSDFGVDSSPDGGAWTAWGLTVVNSILTYFTPSFRTHFTLGYSGRYFAAGGDIGGGAGYGLIALGSVELGASFRFGRLNGAHSNLLVYWWAAPPPFPFPFPSGGELSIAAPVSDTSWFLFEARGDLRLGIFGAATFGGRHRIIDGPTGPSFLKWGVGAAFQYPLPGALLEIGYEYHY